GKHNLCLDIGSSTGGFTQVLLKNNAKEVYSIDVGDNQMVDELRQDSRVKLFENTNFRNINVDEYPKFDLIVCDVSFISLKMIIPNAAKMLKNNGEMIFLIKPQFELKSKNHIINNKKEHLSIINDINNYLNNEGLYISEMTHSPIKGKSGNIEYLIHITTLDNKNIKFKDVVETAFNKLR
ncbi:MAG: SAM-dependent methyltransferase, partial [Finegoldia magna]|nr:SAM-dependent methyltransferase [Finegoldia magna]